MSILAEMLSAVILWLCLVCAPAAHAAEPPLPQPEKNAPVPQPDFSPPPVPEFMLRKPARPLTLEEMQKQADEAAQRARAERDKSAPAGSSAAKGGNDRMK